MFKICSSLFFGLLFSSLLVNSVLAQAPRRYYDWSSTLETRAPQVLGESTPSAGTSVGSVQSYTQYSSYWFGSNIGADSPFYFVKTVQEDLQMTFTFDEVKKEELRLAQAGERLQEIQQLSSTDKPQVISRIADSYQESMEEAAGNLQTLKEENKDVQSLLNQVEEETAKHLVVLEEVSAQVPDQAKEALGKCIEASQKGTDTVADLSGKPAVPSDVVDRLESLKAQGLLTSEEMTKLIAAKNRSEAREELKKYVVEGVLPEADFLRMNENVKNLYKDEFFKLHEVKRFYEMKRLENQKPDEATLVRIQEFAKTYKPGDVVPSDIRRYWVPVIRLEEIQNTLRPDLIDENLVKGSAEDYKKFKEVVERFKPRPEDLAYMENYLRKNPEATLPPEYERMRNLASKYGAQCGAGRRWVDQGAQGASEGAPVTMVGYCVDTDKNIDMKEMPRLEDYAKGKACSGTVVAAKNSTGICSAYPADCIPPGWLKTSTCTETATGTGSEAVGFRNTDTAQLRQMSCPANSHWVPVSYMPSGGYCIPNYTPSSSTYESSSGMVEVPCPAGYRRNYPGGPCLVNYTSGGTPTTYTLPPLTTTPGTYPSPLYPISTMCGSGYIWVPEPINPRGGFCSPEGSPVSEKSSVSSCTPPSTNACPSGQHFSYSSCKCEANTSNTCTSSWPCPAGMSWSTNTCDCRTPSGDWKPPAGTYPTPGASCQPPASGCGSNSYWDYGSCACKSNTSYPTSCTYPAGGCGTGKYWDTYSCSCKTSTTTSGSTSTSTSTPPSGYGTCASGQYWNGSSCVSSTTTTTTNTTTSTAPSGMSREQQEFGCRSCGGTCNWSGDSCNCQCGSSSGSTSTNTNTTTTSQPSTTTTTTTTQEPQPAQETQPSSSSSSDPASACSSAGGSWNGSSCTMP